MTNIAALILGVVEGVTEFLPISSTAHLVLASDLLGIEQSNFVKTFEIAIQSGAILAVVVLYFKKLCATAILKKIAVAFVPTGLLGLIFYRFVKTFLLGNMAVMLWALAIGGAVLILFERFFVPKEAQDVSENDVCSISYRQAVGIGLFQSMGLIPGVSRAAATIVGGMLLGISRGTIVEFSFLLAVPTMLAATGFDLAKNYGEFSLSQFNILAIGFITSFIMALASIRFLLEYTRRYSFVGFGVYRIVAAVAFLAFMA